MPVIACIQLNSTSSIQKNLDTTERLVRRAASMGATLVATPEATTYLGPHDQKVALAEPIDGPTNAWLAALAKELAITLLVGSVPEKGDESRTWNTTVVFGPDGGRLAVYRKIHLFDVDITHGVRFQESQRTLHGDTLVVADTPVAPIGLSICFDLRFPEVYRRLVDQGATMLAVPSAFTLMTGKDHWSPLLRARAIETQSFVLAPAQWGAHDDKGLRHSYGHSMIIDPWGHVVAQCSDGVGLCIADIDVDQVNQIRQQIPMDANRRL